MTQRIDIGLNQQKSAQLIELDRLNKARYGHVCLLEELVYISWQMTNVSIYMYMYLLLMSNEKKRNRYLDIILQVKRRD